MTQNRDPYQAIAPDPCPAILRDSSIHSQHSSYKELSLKRQMPGILLSND